MIPQAAAMTTPKERFEPISTAREREKLSWKFLPMYAIQGLEGIPSCGFGIAEAADAVQPLAVGGVLPRDVYSILASRKPKT